MANRARAFNEWMRRFIEAPEQFEREWQSVEEFLTDVADGREPSYGESCDAYLAKIETELQSAG